MKSKRFDLEFAIFTLVLLLIMLLCVFNLRSRVIYKVYSQNDNSYAQIETVIGNKSSYDINTEYNGYTVNKVATRAFYDKPYLKEVSLPDTIKTIERLSFSKCDRLESINLENVEKIQRNAFSYCKKLDNIKLNITVLNSSVFYKCESLKTIELSNVISIYSLSLAYTSIETLTLPNLAYASSEAFYYMPSLKTINVSNSYIYNNLVNNYNTYFNNEGVSINLVS